MLFELRMNIFYNSYIIWSLNCEHAPLSKHRQPLQAEICTLIEFGINCKVSDFFIKPGLHHWVKKQLKRLKHPWCLMGSWPLFKYWFKHLKLNTSDIFEFYTI